MAEKMRISHNWAEIYRNMSKFVIDIMTKDGTDTVETF
jgi:hypothetical protein